MKKMTQIIQIKNVSKKYNDTSILSSIDIVINQGEVIGLIGINGIGKTTLIKMILGLINNFEGEIYLFNKLSSNFEGRKNIFYLPEKFNPPTQLTGYEFIQASNRFYNIDISKEFIQQTCEKIKFNYQKLNNKISSYSKGMIQKIGIIAMITSNTKLWILDEPMSGLDPIARYELKQIFKHHHQQNGTIFFTSHLLSDIQEISTRIIILHNSNIYFDGNFQQLLHNHQTNDIESAYLKVIAYE